MITRLIKYLLFRIYSAGRNEYRRRIGLINKAKLEGVSKISPTTDIEESAVIVNHQKDSSKLTIGEKSVIRGELVVMKHGGEIHVGDYCFIGYGTKLISGKKISIGNRVLISHNVNIYDNNSHPLNAKDRHEDFKHIFTKGLQESIELNDKEIIIGNDVWIGFNATIHKGVTIGEGAVIGANTIITKDVPPYAVVTGEISQKIVKFAD